MHEARPVVAFQKPIKSNFKCNFVGSANLCLVGLQTAVSFEKQAKATDDEAPRAAAGNRNA